MSDYPPPRSPRSRAPSAQRTSHRSLYADRVQRREVTWPMRVGTVWGTVLILNFFWPVTYIEGFGSSKWLFVWDGLKEAEGLSQVLFLLPLPFGIAALAVARSGTNRARGLVYLMGGMACLFLGVIDPDGRKLMFSQPAGDLGFSVGLMLVLGPILIGAGNHVQRREDGRSLPSVLAGLGGLCLVLLWFIPVVRGESIFSGLFSSRALGDAWPLALWVLALITTGVMSAALLLPAVDGPGMGRRVSIGVRIGLIGLPLAVLLMIVFSGGGRGFLTFVVTMTWLLSRVYGLLILTAAGLALVMRRPPADHDRDWTEAF